MAKLYISQGYSNEFFQDVTANAVEGQYLITIQNDQGQYLSAHENQKHMYWSDDVYGWWEYFSLDLETNRLKTIHHTYVWFDGKDMWQYPTNKVDTNQSVLVMGNISNLCEEDFYDV
jgi:hypothetical protein